MKNSQKTHFISSFKVIDLFRDVLTNVSPKIAICMDRGITQGHMKKFQDPLQALWSIGHRSSSKLLFFETPSNPFMLEKVIIHTHICRRHF